MVVLFGIGILLGGLTRSWWSLAFPAAPCALFLIAAIVAESANTPEDFHSIDFLTAVMLVYVVPTAAGTVGGVLGRRAFDRRR